MFGKGVFPGSGMICLRGERVLLVVEPRQSARPGFTKPVRRAGAGHRVRSPRPARSGLPTVSAPLDFEAPGRADCLGSTGSN